jgi:voltage-gated potassium channel
MPQAPHRRSILRPWPIILTVGLLALIALSVASVQGYLAVGVVVAIGALVALVHFGLRGSRAFSLALANLGAVYACVFLFFTESSFPEASLPALLAGFALPLAAFAAGAIRHRDAIGKLIGTDRLREQRNFARILGWLGPVMAIGVLTFLIPEQGPVVRYIDLILLAAMAGIAVIVLKVSREVAIFLLDTGLLFEAFFERVAGLIVPAFAFLTFYSLIVIVFAAVYSLLGHVASGLHFRVDGVPRAITFSEGLFFSLTTLSSVGYGDITPVTGLSRFLAGIEIVSGVLLLLFGFNEIFSFARTHPSRVRPER